MTATARIALLHPGAMGACVGACARAAGCSVGWATAGRSAASHERAEAAGLRPVDDLAALLAESDLVVSVCPPAHALATARQVMAAGYAGLYLDANAIAPATAGIVADTVRAGGARYVDGGLVGPPPLAAGTTRLYLSGDAAREVLPCFAGSALEAVDLGAEATAASALKMAYAAWTKGSAALLLAVAALAEAAGVRGALEREWQRSQPGLGERLAATARGNAPKAWRFVGEMEEVAASFDAHGLPGGFHRAAAEIYGALVDFRDGALPADAAAVLQALDRRAS